VFERLCFYWYCHWILNRRVFIDILPVSYHTHCIHNFFCIFSLDKNKALEQYVVAGYDCFCKSPHFDHPLTIPICSYLIWLPSWRSLSSPSNHSSLLLEDQASPSPSTMSICILLHSLMQNFSVYLVISSLVPLHPLMMTILHQYSSFCIGKSTFFFHFFSTLYTFIINLNSDCLMKTINRLQIHLGLWILQKFPKYFVSLWSTLADTCIFYTQSPY